MLNIFYFKPKDAGTNVCVTEGTIVFVYIYEKRRGLCVYVTEKDECTMGGWGNQEGGGVYYH